MKNATVGDGRFVAGCLIGNANLRAVIVALLERHGGLAVLLDDGTPPPEDLDLVIVSLSPYGREWLSAMTRLRARSGAPALAIAPPMTRPMAMDLALFRPVETLVLPFDLPAFTAALDAVRRRGRRRPGRPRD